MAVETYEDVIRAAVKAASAKLKLSADELTLFENAIAGDDALKKGWMRQDDFSRRSNTLSEDIKKHEKDLDYAERMKTWADENVPRYNKVVDAGLIDKDTGEELWSAQKAKLEQDLADAQKAIGGDMDAAEVDKRVRAIIKDIGGAGTLTREEITALYQAEGKKVAQEVFDSNWKVKETDFNTKTIPIVNGFVTAATLLAMHFEKETGEKWTVDKQKELHKLMSEDQMFDAFQLEDKFMTPYRDKAKAKTDMEAEIQRRVDEERAKMKMPGAGHEDYIPQPDQKGALQKALEGDSKGDFETMIRQHSVEAAKELAAAGKG
jgi:hypothetical protein